MSARPSRGFRGAALAALSGAVLYAAMAFGLHQGALPPPHDQPLELYTLAPSELAFYLAANLFVLLLGTLLAGTLAERLRWTGGALEEANQRVSARNAWPSWVSLPRGSRTKSEIRSARSPAPCSS